jgi:16S rRNA processing protein RimM
MARKSRSLTAPAAPEFPACDVADKDLVLMGIFGAAVGLKGEVRIKSYTQDPVDIAAYGPLTARRAGLRDHRLREAGEVVVARIKGVTDRTAGRRH